LSPENLNTDIQNLLRTLTVLTNMTEKFTPDPETLAPLVELIAIATITDDDVLGAVDAWEGDPPDPKFEGILRADSEA